MHHLLQATVFLVFILGSSSCQKLWHSNFFGISKKSRNEFFLKNVSIDEKFTSNKTVDYWRSINSEYSTYAVGISSGAILVLNVTKTENPTDFKITDRYKEVNGTFRDAILVQIPYKNRRGGGIFLVCISSEQKLLWFDVETVELIWTWNLGNNAARIKLGFNNVLDRNQLFLSSLSTMYIYNFDVTERKLWLTETLEVPGTIGQFDMLPFRNHYFLLVPQKSFGELLIFRFVDDHFKKYRSISAAGIEQVVAFQVNYKSFFAVNGLEAGIYQFGQRKQIMLEQIANSHLEGLNYWMPVRVNNLRKNFILFGQRLVEHGSHRSLETESFIYNGEYFEEHEDIPCQIFGEKFNSLQCLAPAHDSIGIQGAAAISVGNNLGLLLAKRSPHNLFRINFEVRDIESPIREQMKQLKETKIQLQKLLDERLNATLSPVVMKPVPEKAAQGEDTERSASHKKEKALLAGQPEKTPIVGARNNIDLNEKLDNLLERLRELKEKMDKVEAMEKTANFKKITINGKAIINSASVQNASSESLNDRSTSRIFEDTVRKDQNQTIGGTKTFTDLHVKNLYFDSLNGIKSTNILFHDSDSIELSGNVVFEKPVAIMKNIQTDWINGVPSTSIPIMEAYIGDTLPFETMKVENIHTREFDKLPVPEDWSKTGKLDYITGRGAVVFVPHNVTVKRVNGENFEELLKQICFVNIPNHLPGTMVINGNVTTEQPPEVEYVNDLKFPESLISVTEQEDVAISGRKVFRNSLVTNVFNSNGNYMNELKSEDYFTLSTPQEITGKTTFTNLEITQKFLHDGKTIGDRVSNFLPNPTLANTFNVTSNVDFEVLEVTGSVIVEYMDSLNYGKILEDIIYKDEDISTINSIKEFSEGLTIRNNLEITSNSINLIPLDQIVTKDTLQVLNLPQLNGNVSIETVEAKQLIGGINVTKLEQEVVKTFGQQFIPSILILEDLEAENLEVREKLNEIPVENFYTITGDRIMDHKPTFDEVQVENLSVLKNVEGSFAEVNLRNFTNNRLSYSKAQNIEGHITMENTSTENIHCQDDIPLCQVVLNEEKTEDAMMKKISSGNIRVKELFVKDDLDVEQMNGIPLKEIQTLENKSLVIEGNVFFSGLAVNKLSGVPLDQLLEEVVRKNETSVDIRGFKVFQKGFVVQKLIETDKLNDVPIENLLTKNGHQLIEAPLHIFGNVTFKNDLNISEKLNDVSLEELQDYFEYHDNVYAIKGDITFDRLEYIDSLEVLGNINGEVFHDVMNNIAYLNGKLILSNDMEFTRAVDVDGNMEIVEHLNGISISDSNDNIVYLNKINDNTIDSPVTFTGENVFAHHLIIETNLITKWMRGLNLEAFKENAIFLNKGFLEGTYHFQNITLNEKLNTKVINKIDMSKIIPLASEQDIDQFLIKNVIFLNNVTVEDSVSGIDLKKEYANSVLANKEQTIIAELYFKNNTLIKHNLEVGGLLNGYPIDKIVTTDTNQTLTATYNFSSKTVMESNMYATGFVNSINMSDWENGAIKVSSKEPQVIVAPWYFGNNLTFEDTLESMGGIHEFDMDEKMQLISDEKDHNKRMESQYEDDYKNVCRDIHTLNKKSKKQTYKFESLEEIQLLKYHHSIRKTHFFNFDKPSIILNGIGSCQIDIFQWQDEIFVRESEFTMGEIDQIISVRSDDSFFFVVKTVPNSACNDNGTLVWQYVNGSITKLQNIENQQLIQESLVPLTFYGLDKNSVTEFKIDMSKAIPVQPYRRWKIREENAAFMPRGLGTGLAVRTGKKMITLLRDEPIIDNDIGFEGAMIKGEMKISDNFVVPGRNNSNMVVINVGPKSLQKTFLAIVFHGHTIVHSNVDVIKIYEDFSSNAVFQEIPTYNPTSLISLELGNGETLLLILENEEKLQIYRYRGVEGFRLYLSADIFGSDMLKMAIPVSSNEGTMETVAVVRKNQIKILKPVMIGNPTKENIECP